MGNFAENFYLGTPFDLKKQPFYSVFLVKPAYNIILECPPPIYSQSPKEMLVFIL